MQFQEKSPVVLKILAAAFMLAPIGNFAMSFYVMGVPAWYYPTNFFELSMKVNWYDWAWNGAVFVSGVLLLKRSKLSWMCAIVSIFLASAFNIHKAIFDPVDRFNLAFLATSLILSCVAVVLVMHFRFPYLDRRDRWLKIHRRVRVNKEIAVEGVVAGKAMLEDISLGGALLTGIKAGIGDQLILRVTDDLVLKAKVIDQRADGVGVQFDQLENHQAAQLSGFIKSVSKNRN